MHSESKGLGINCLDIRTEEPKTSQNKIATSNLRFELGVCAIQDKLTSLSVDVSINKPSPQFPATLFLHSD
jgi:hypothetical protein